MRGVHFDPFEYYRFLRRVKEFVLENLDRKITLQDAARVAGMERTHLSRMFKRRTGHTFTTWVREVRLAQARHLLSATEMTVKEVAAEVWYGGMRSMERAFRHAVGMSASDYKNVEVCVKPCDLWNSQTG